MAVVTASACGGQVGATGGSHGTLDGADGEPSPRGTLVTLASAQTEITSLALDTADIYWTQGFGGWATGNPYPMDGQVLRAALAGGDVATLATSQRYPGTITLGDGAVYWTNAMFGNANGWIMRVGAQGGAPTTFASAQDPIAMAVDRENVYWTVVGALLRQPVDGGAVTTLASDGQSRGHLALGEDAVYWGTVDGIMSVPLDGGVPALMAVGPATGSMVLHSTDLYWVEGAPPSLVKTTVDGGASTTIASVSNTVGGLDTDGTSVYWTDTAGGAVLKAGVDASAPVTLASRQGGPTALAVDSQSVYWINDTANNYAIVKLTPR